MELYFFDNDFMTPIGVTCDKIETFGGVQLLQIECKIESKAKDYFDVLSKYEQNIFGDYRNKLIYRDRIVCTDLKVLLDITIQMPSSERDVIKELLQLIDKNKNRALDINPLPMPFLDKEK